MSPFRESSILGLFTKASSHKEHSELTCSKDSQSVPKQEIYDNAEEENNQQDESQSRQVIEHINENHIGRRTVFDTVYGSKPVCYADYTASGRALDCIEDYIRQHVLPLYGNTHTNTSITGQQTTAFREEAREIIANAVNAKISGETAEDCVVFAGQGTTSAIHKLVTALGLNVPFSIKDPDTRPVVFVGPFEHHSNLLSWRESCAQVIQVPETSEGIVDVTFLIEKLQLYTDRPLKIGSFSAASNLTGILTDVNHISAVLHMHGALAFWDYATCAPYVKIDMNPFVPGAMRPYVYKDAVFLSGHKFIGGPNSPGVLICKKRLLGNTVPTVPSGGTVMYVTKDEHHYLSNVAEREEGGTPDIIGSIRLGMAFELKQRVGSDTIMKIEEHHLQTVRESLETNPNIVLLGRNNIEKLPIFSFLIRFGQRFLHYNFVCALLNDLFGIQTRGGCQCAGPYAIRILGITDEAAEAIGTAVRDHRGILRGGFSRISFPYFMPPSDVQYILQALHFIANDGWKFLPHYRFTESGSWTHYKASSDRKWCSTFPTLNIPSEYSTGSLTENELEQRREEMLQLAQKLAESIMAGQDDAPPVPLLGEIRDPHYTTYRWFAYPSEAAVAIRAGQAPLVTDLIAGPVQPTKYIDTNPQQRSWLKSNGYPLIYKIMNHKSESNGSTIESSSNETTLEQESDADDHTPYEHVHRSTNEVMKKVMACSLFPTPPKHLMESIGLAIRDWNMIQDGDRLLIGISGGKDSMGLLHALIYLQNISPIQFKIACANVDIQSPTCDSSPLKEYLKSLGIPFFYLSEEVITSANTNGHSLSASLARMKQNALYTCCRKNKYTKLVLGHHLDDFAESFFMSTMYNGKLRIMRAKYWNEKKDIEIIRPLVYAREATMTQFAMDARLFVMKTKLRIGTKESQERLRIKRMLSVEENICPGLFTSLRRALQPMMTPDHDGSNDFHVEDYLGDTTMDEEYQVTIRMEEEVKRKKYRKRDKLRAILDIIRI